MYNSNDPFISSLLIVEKLIKYKHIADDLQIKHDDLQIKHNDLQIKYKHDYLDTLFFNSTSDPIVFLQQLFTRFSEFYDLFSTYSTNNNTLFNCDPTIKFKLLSLINILTQNAIQFFIVNKKSFNGATITTFFKSCSNNIANMQNTLIRFLCTDASTDTINIKNVDVMIFTSLKSKVNDIFNIIKKNNINHNFQWKL
jgi:hypothetical protein